MSTPSGAKNTPRKPRARRPRSNNNGKQSQGKSKALPRYEASEKTAAAVAHAKNRTFQQGQTDHIQISAIPDANAIYLAAAAFVQYGLILGLPPADALTALMGMQVVLFTVMTGASKNVINKAPRIYWQLENALRSKTVKSRGMTFNYNWDTSSVALVNASSMGGVTFQPNLTTSNDFGTFFMNPAAGTLPALGIAVEAVNNLFSIYDKVHALMSPVDDFLQDASAFAYRNSVVDGDAAPALYGGYVSCNSEVPILSWFGYLGFATSNFTVNGSPQPRIPRHTRYALGNACNNIGLRLCMPRFIKKEFALTTVDFTPVDLQSWLAQCLDLLQNINLKLLDANRSNGNATPGGAPSSYFTRNITITQYNWNKLMTMIAGFIPFAPMWATVATEGFTAIMVGTNNIDLTIQNQRQDYYCNVASSRELRPVYNRRTNKVLVPFPTIFEDTLNQMTTLFPNTLPIDGDGSWAGNDWLNSADTTGNPISIIDGPTFRDQLYETGRADNLYNEIVPLTSVDGDDTCVKTALVGQKIILVDGARLGKAEELVLRTFKLAQPWNKGYAKDAARWLKIRSTRVELLAAARDSVKKGQAGEKDKLLAALRTSTDVTTTLQTGLIGETPFDSGLRVETTLQQPMIIADTESGYGGVDQSRIVHEEPFAYNTVRLTNVAPIGTRFSNGEGFLRDPSSTLGNEESQTILEIGKGSFEQSFPTFGKIIDDAGRALGPEWSGLLQVGGAIVGGIKKAVQKRRARKAAAKGGRRS